METERQWNRRRGQRPALLTSREVARLFRVDHKTVTRWAKNGSLPSIITPGGHYRYHRSEVLALRERLEAME